jgi:ParB-like chromosome segregation protein Spo0J
VDFTAQGLAAASSIGLRKVAEFALGVLSRHAERVRDHGDGFELVAGFHRIAAANSLGMAEVRVVVREMGTEDADRAVENITRKQLSPSHQAVPAPAASVLAATTLGYLDL